MKILLLDIETAPNLAAVWGLWNQNIGLNQLIKPGYTLCWAAKWLGDSRIEFSSIMDGHKTMLRRIHKLLDQADAVIHYNGTKFDIPTLQKEFLLAGMAPPSPIKQIDLLATARRKFRLASNKLEFVAQALGLGGKTKHKGFELWLECMAKKPDAWRDMQMYNMQDVKLLEGVYERLKPWITGHPNRAAFGGRPDACPTCGSTHIQRRGYAVARNQRYRRFQCMDCGKWLKSATAEKGSRTRYTEA